MPNPPGIREYGQTLSADCRLGVLPLEMYYAKLPLATLQSKAIHYLHPQEWAYFQTLCFPKKQHSYLLGRYTAKKALQRLDPGLSLAAAYIDYGVTHFPIIYHPTKGNIQTSYSHSGSAAIAMIFPEAYPVGIDLEKIDACSNAAIQRQLTSHELTLLEAWQDKFSWEALLATCWVSKEALSKVLHTGLTLPFKLLAIKALLWKEDRWEVSFHHFTQYQAMVFTLNDCQCAIVYCKNTRLDFDLTAFLGIA